MVDALLTIFTRRNSTLAEILDEIQGLQSAYGSSRFKRAWNFIKDPDKIVVMKKKFDDAVALFQVFIPSSNNQRSKVLIFIFPPHKLRSMVTTGRDVAKVLEGVDIERQMSRIISKLRIEIGTHPHPSCTYLSSTLLLSYSEPN